MPSRSKDKGNRGERELLEKLREYGFLIRKVPLSGAAQDWPGDLVEADGTIWEVKRRSQGFLKIYKWHSAGSDIVAFRGDRQEWMVCMPLRTFVKRSCHGDAGDWDIDRDLPEPSDGLDCDRDP